ncbi:MAG TPA: hypothetical protein VGV67_09235 [Solirubrobacteraceae bacterium]|nr:hypothetical protein [Solirubrobacteraceae bacterium]
MALHRGIDGSEPLRAQPVSEPAGTHEHRHTSRPWQLTGGTLACPRCDAPVSLGGRALPLTHALHCPFCRHSGALRDFLSLATPSRPAHVAIRMLPRARRIRSAAG